MILGHVRLVTQWWPPEPVTLPLWIAQGLRDCGWDVDVITGVPNYPDGKVAPGYASHRYQREDSQGFKVTRTPLYPSHDTSPTKRLANYISWAVSASLMAIASHQPDVHFVYGTPATASLPAILARIFRRTPYIVTVQDIWPDSVVQSEITQSSPIARIAEKGLTAFVGQMYKRASAIVVISPGARSLLASRGVPEEKIHHIYNWIDEKLFYPRRRVTTIRNRFTEDRNEFLILYAGNIGTAQDLETAVRAICLTPPHVKLLIAGDGVEESKVRRLADAIAPNRITFLGRVPQAEIAEISSVVDAQLVILQDKPLYRTTMPSKVQAILASGTPAIVSVGGDASDLINGAEAGMTASPGDPHSLAEAILNLSKLPENERLQMGERGVAYYQEHMSKRVGAARLTELLIAGIGDREKKSRN
ncbi:Undecaprenyl-phosphate galactose phosphotransferase (fragment) [Nostocoides australiense Ben110]|uniref:Undecaprenyl-phosphate galactose phosphotransferase n=1 Tax=Nostocoides australiense Ben110 TaxID=1193182 RepID=W6JVM5_9MICO